MRKPSYFISFLSDYGFKVTFGDEQRGRGERRKGDSLEEMLKLDVVADRFERAYQELSDINAVIDAELKARSKS